MKSKSLFASVLVWAIAAIYLGCGGNSPANAAPRWSPGLKTAMSYISVSLAPSSMNFGQVTVGSSAAQTVTVTNNGTVSATISSITVDNSAFQVSAPAFPLSLNPSQSFQATVTFAPSSATSYSGWLSVYSNAMYSPNSISVSGTGITSPPSAGVSPTSLSFGNQTTGTSSAPQTITVSNAGLSTLTVSSIASDNSAFKVSTTALPLSLGPSQSFQASVTFTPSSATSYSGWISVYSNGQYSPNSISVSGTGVSPTSTQLTVSPTSLNFGTQTLSVTSPAQSVTLSNSTSSGIEICGVGTSNPQFALVSYPTCPTTISPGQSVTLKVAFTPTVSGTVTGWLTIAGASSTVLGKVALSGSGASSSGSSQLTVNPTSLNFGTVPLSDPSPAQTVTLSNSTSSGIEICGVGTSNPQFAVVSYPTCPTTISPGQSVAVEVAFTPTVSGTVTGWLTIGGASSSILAKVALSGSGASSTTSGSLAVSPTSLSFGNVTLGVASSSQVVTVKNTSTSSSVTVSGFSVTPSAFALTAIPTVPMTLSPGQSSTLSVDFTPTAVGTATGSLTITSNASPSTSTVSLSGSGVNTSSGTLNLSTTSLQTGFLQQPYSAVLSASSTDPTWSVSSGALPPGLTLNATTGQITGSPTQSGTFNVTIQAVGSTSGTGSKSFNLTVASGVYDQYGGITELACPNGPAAHFYTQKINGRWWLCTPAGHAFWMRGVYHADATDSTPDYQGVTLGGSACSSPSSPSPSSPCSVIEEKYGNNSTTWGPQMVRRLESWGFNTTAEFSSLYVQPTMTNSAWTSTSDNSNPVKMPFVGFLWPSHYARNPNSYAQPVKDIVGPTKSSVYTGLRHASPDVFDPNFAKWLQGDLADYTNAEYNWIHSPHSDYLIGFNADDTDELLGFGPGPDFPSLDNGNLESGAASAEQANLAWIVLITPPTQSSGTDANGNSITYSDTTVYSKQALSNWLSSRYGGNIALLNSAWGSNYTTFGSSGGWGNGSGLLDEDGTHAWVPKDPYQLTGASSQMQADLNAFLLYYAQEYFSVIKSAIANAAPGVLYLGPTNLGGWGAPPHAQILQAAGQYCDILMLGSIPTGCLSCTDDQARMDFVAQYGGDKPWANWEGFFAQPDSYMSVYPAPDDSYPQNSTQAQRGQMFQSMITGMLNAKDSSTGTYHFVGYKWWELYDNRGEQANWGLLTRRDNGYDGASAVTATTGMDSWGYPSGGEQVSYGDFLDAVTSANVNVYKTLLGLP